MRNKKIISILLICMALLTCTGCGTRKEEKEKGKAYVNQYKEQITKYIKETYGNSSKITNMQPCYTTKHDAVWFGSENYANGMVKTEVKSSGEKFDVLYIPAADKYYTDKNKAEIEDSFRKYVINAIGTDKIIYVKLKYGIDPIYYAYANYVSNDVTKFEQLYDNKNMVLIECYLKNTDVNKLKERSAFNYLENIVLNGSNEFGHMGVVFINIDDKNKLNEKEWNKIRYFDYFDFGYVTVNEKIYTVLTSDYSKKYPNNTYSIRYDKDKHKLVSLVF